MKTIRNRYLMLIDIMLIILAYFVGAVLIYHLSELPNLLAANALYLLLTAVLYIAVLWFGGVYRVLWSAINPLALGRIMLLLAGTGAGSILLSLAFSLDPVHIKLAILLNIEIFVCVLGLRLFCLMAERIHQSKPSENGKRTIIIGAGSLGLILLRDILGNEELNNNVIGFVDDQDYKVGKLVYGKPVLGTCDELPLICRAEGIEELIFAIYSIDQKRKAEILNLCSETGLRVRIMTGIAGTLNGAIEHHDIRDVQIEDLLERDPVQLDNQSIANDIRGKVVMVTGGGGSIGSELCRQIIKFDPATLIILDICENTTYVLQQELEEAYPDQKLDVLIASVRDKTRLENIFAKYKPDLIFHAAAHKHVPLMEYSPCEAIKNNVFGTYNVAWCAEKYGAKRMILISTDKAVNPTNAMGASKRLCEMIVEAFSKNGKTRFAAVRFGNVLGSNGSVVPRFQKQIAEGGPVTVTHKDITRFFMTIPEAAQLVLQAMSYAKGGEIFVLDMGKPVRIYDLAEKMIRLAGRMPHVDITIRITGLRPGEKLYEELMMNEEGLEKTRHKKIFIGKLSNMTIAQLDGILARLETVTQADEMQVKAVLAEVVPTYHPQITADAKPANTKTPAAV